jgi:hypothetical protein
MNNITLQGIRDGNTQDDRMLLVLEVRYNDEIFPWNIRMHPTYVGTYDEYITEHASSIYADIASKLEQWELLDPKEREIESPFGKEPIVVPITREEVVTPTYPDYYVLRANEYPPLAEQMDAFWKGGDAAEQMQQKILDIKLKYPKSQPLI